MHTTARTDNPRPSRARSAGRPGVNRAERWLAAGVALCCLAVLVVATLVPPASEGHGTHTALGMPDCGWATALDAPCPTCGMTTSFAYAAHGDLAASVLTQPMGALLVVATSAMFWGSLLVACTGSFVGRYAASALSLRILFVLLAVGAAAWAYKFLTWTS